MKAEGDRIRTATFDDMLKMLSEHYEEYSMEEILREIVGKRDQTLPGSKDNNDSVALNQGKYDTQKVLKENPFKPAIKPVMVDLMAAKSGINSADIQPKSRTGKNQA